MDKVNAEIKTANGSIVYIDKSSKHMYELNNKIRLIDASTYPLKNSDEFIGFICGIISQDHDIEQMYLDSFLKVAKLEEKTSPNASDSLKTSASFMTSPLSSAFPWIKKSCRRVYRIRLLLPYKRDCTIITT